jgi:hypothetical protein
LHLDLAHGDLKSDVGELSVPIQLDPFAEREDSDPMPEVTRALPKLVAAALRALDKHERVVTHRVHRDPGFAYTWIPKVVFDYEEPGRESLEKWLALQDVLMRESTRIARYKFFAREATDRTLSQMVKLPGGLWVTAIDRSEDGISAGDVVLEIGGEAATPQVLSRRLRAASLGSTVPLLIRRGADRVNVNLPVRD